MTLPQSRRLGSAGPQVFPLGLGCMGMSDMYGPSDEGEAVATIHAALDAGITLLDTGDYYGAGANELLIGRALPPSAVAGTRYDQHQMRVLDSERRDDAQP